MLPETENSYDQTEGNYICDSLTTEPYLTLDTIVEEVKESCLSEGSTASLTPEENLSLLERDSEIKEDKTGESVRNKIKIQWMNDDDEEEDLEHLQEEQPEWYPTHPDIDRGWAWVVLASVFTMFILCMGLLSSTGLYYQQMLQEFGHSRSYTAWLGSLINSFFMLAGPLSSIFIKKAGCRASIVLGSILMTVGYLASAIAPNLEFILISYGIVVATGMNFIYSGQIIALAQYFSKYHSFATAASMTGVGVGMFGVVRFLNYVIIEFGWRNSFIFCAAISIQCCVLAFLIFPLKDIERNLPKSMGDKEEELRKIASLEEINALFRTPAGKRVFYQSNILNRSVSSLRLSIGAGFLSSSLASLSNDSRYSSIYSNHPSFCSKTSHHPGEKRNSHLELINLPLRSNQNSFCSRGSFYGVRSLRSNSQSFFSVKNSQCFQMDLQHHYLPNLMTARDSGIDNHAQKEMNSTRSPSKISNLLLPLKENSITHQDNYQNCVPQSKCTLLINKFKSIINNLTSALNIELLLDPMFWFLNLSMFFTMFATIKLCIIYKDLSAFLGVEDYYSLAMSGIGIGDIIGRVSGGMLASVRWVNPIFCYGIAMLLCGITIGLHIFATSGPIFLLVTFFFGLFYGQQNVLLTLAPAVIFGKDKLVTVFGYVLFFAGLGALFGAPVAGYIVDVTGNYNGVLVVSVSSCFLGGLCMLLCFFIFRRKNKRFSSSYTDVI